MNFKQYIQEAPISYDSETEKLAKKDTMHVQTKTKWSSEKPPKKDASVEEIKKWVDDNKDNGVLDNVYAPVGEGASKIVLFNDHKTVFKYTHSIKGGNQIKNEIKIYKDILRSSKAKKYLDIIPKIYDYGESWMIQQHIPFTDHNFGEEFESKFGFPVVDFRNIVLYTYSKIFRGKWKLEDVLSGASEEEKNILNSIMENKNLKLIADFGVETGSVTDYNESNLGMDNKGKVYVLDFGWDTWSNFE